MRFVGIVSLVIVVLNLASKGLIAPQNAIIMFIDGVILQRFSDNLFKIILTLVSLGAFIYTITGGTPQNYSFVLQTVLALSGMVLGMSVMFRGFFKSK